MGLRAEGGAREAATRISGDSGHALDIELAVGSLGGGRQWLVNGSDPMRSSGWPGRDAALDRVRLVAGVALGALLAIAANTAELPSALLMALYARSS